MRSYTNRDGEKVNVSDEHLNVAIEIFEELKKSSPSGIVRWARHRRMMESEGFSDSESSESYRQMIKHERRARGVIETPKERANLVADNKLQAIKDEIGEMREAKLEAQADFNKLNRLKRELTKEVALIESVERVLSEKDFSKPVDFTPIYTPKMSGKSMIAVLTDIHYGAHVDIEGYKYNPDMTRDILMEYADKLLDMAESNNVDYIYVMNLGDLVEHDNMRRQNTFNVDMTVDEQIVNVTDIIFEFLQKLSKYVNVVYSAISGNHDRYSGNKNDSLFGSSMVNISNKIIEGFVKYSGNEHLKYVAADPYDHWIEMNGRNFLFVHGDKTPLKKNSVLAEQSLLYNVQFDAIIGGHIHHHTLKEVGHDKYVVTFGSIKGSDEYSLKTIGSASTRSQGAILVDEDGEFEIRQIKL